MKIYYTRHGQSRWNLERKLCGRIDIGLTEKGLEQARELAEKASGLGIDLIISSPLKRARDTAEEVSKKIGAPVITDERLLEMSYGNFEGTDFYGEAFRKVNNQIAMRFPGGESRLDAACRVYGFLDEIRAKYPDRTILLVAHGGISKLVNAYFEDMTNDEFFDYILPNCELKEYNVSPLESPAKE